MTCRRRIDPSGTRLQCGLRVRRRDEWSRSRAARHRPPAGGPWRVGRLASSPREAAGPLEGCGAGYDLRTSSWSTRTLSRSRSGGAAAPGWDVRLDRGERRCAAMSWHGGPGRTTPNLSNDARSGPAAESSRPLRVVASRVGRDRGPSVDSGAAAFAAAARIAPVPPCRGRLRSRHGGTPRSGPQAPTATVTARPLRASNAKGRPSRAALRHVVAIRPVSLGSPARPSIRAARCERCAGPSPRPCRPGSCRSRRRRRG